MKIQIREGTIDEVLSVYQSIPEFQNAPAKKAYEQRLFHSTRYLILIACNYTQPIGFKVGYEKDTDGSFYSWMGGVASEYRRHGVAGQLMDVMIQWAKEQGYITLRFKTRNCFKPMLIFGIKRGFDIYGIEPRETLEDYRILLEKKL